MTSPKNINHILFDLDGTLIQSIDMLYESYQRFAKEQGFEASRQDFDALNGPSLREACEILREKYSLSPDTDELYKQYLSIVSRSYAQSKPYPSAISLIHQCRSRFQTISLVTSSPKENVEALLQKQPNLNQFDMKVFGDEVQKSKPHPDIYLLALSRIQSEPDHCIVVEDSLHGVEASVQAGLLTIAVTHSFEQSELLSKGALWVFEDLDSVSGFLFSV